MKYKELAKTGEKVSAVGLGCMGMSAAYGRADETESVATLEHALDLGINFWDTAAVELAAKDLQVIEAIAKKYPNIGPRYSARENKFVKK